MIWDELDSGLAQLKADGLLRRRRTLEAPCGPEALVDGRRLIAFCSNDYLGLANHPTLVTAAREAAERWGVGSGASHVVSGHLWPHQALEERLAAFVGRERALYFGTGYMANLAIVPALVGRDDAVFARDSLRTGARVLGTALAIGRSIQDVETWPERISAVTLDQVAAAARAVLHDERAVTSILLRKEAS